MKIAPQLFVVNKDKWKLFFRYQGCFSYSGTAGREIQLVSQSTDLYALLAPPGHLS